MQSNFVIALAAGVGAGIFVWQKTSRRGGGDFKRAVAPAAISGVLAFLIMMTLLWSL